MLMIVQSCWTVTLSEALFWGHVRPWDLRQILAKAHTSSKDRAR